MTPEVRGSLIGLVGYEVLEAGAEQLDVYVSLALSALEAVQPR